jgi:hypothetical protein
VSIGNKIMRNIGDFHEIIDKLICVGNFLIEHDEMEKKEVVCDLVEQLYNEHLELGKHLKENDPYLLSIKHIKEWVDENKKEMI